MPLESAPYLQEWPNTAGNAESVAVAGGRLTHSCGRKVWPIQVVWNAPVTNAARPTTAPSAVSPTR